MDNWYSQYFAQTWYKNTYLVNTPDQIAQTIKKPKEWNNIHDSGCNLTCLAMIVGIDPAYLASLVNQEKKFKPDEEYDALNTKGDFIKLVWDQNIPHENFKTLELKNFWHPSYKRFISVSVEFILREITNDFIKGSEIVKVAHAKGQHVVCGPDNHAFLVAGTKGTDYFLWDPDPKENINKYLNGNYKLRNLFKAHSETEFVVYEHTLHFNEK